MDLHKDAHSDANDNTEVRRTVVLEHKDRIGLTTPKLPHRLVVDGNILRRIVKKNSSACIVVPGYDEEVPVAPVDDGC